MRQSQRDRLFHAAGRVDHLLDLRRAHAITRGLDHVVAPADVVEEALLVQAHDAARPLRQLFARQFRRAPRRRTETLSRAPRILPVAGRHTPAPVHPLTIPPRTPPTPLRLHPPTLLAWAQPS